MKSGWVFTRNPYFFNLVAMFRKCRFLFTFETQQQILTLEQLYANRCLSKSSKYHNSEHHAGYLKNNFKVSLLSYFFNY